MCDWGRTEPPRVIEDEPPALKRVSIDVEVTYEVTEARNAAGRLLYRHVRPLLTPVDFRVPLCERELDGRGEN